MSDSRRASCPETASRAGHRRLDRRLLGLRAFVLALIVGAGGARAAAEEAAVLAFDIPAQPLAAALEAFSTTSRIQILYDSRLAGTRFSSPVRGLLPPETALRQLLTGTDLIGRFTAARDVVITTPEADNRLEAISGGERVAVVAGLFTLQTLRVEATPRAAADYSAYAGIVQADLQKLLQGDERTGEGRYRVGVKLWVKQSGEIARSEVFDSSGDLERDEAIAQVLANAMLSEGPPADMPQPIQVVISAWPV